MEKLDVNCEWHSSDYHFTPGGDPGVNSLFN